jgi:hypothetical protein
MASVPLYSCGGKKIKKSEIEGNVPTANTITSKVIKSFV